MTDTWKLISILKWSAFGRIGLTFIAPYNPRETDKIRKDIRIAKWENYELDKWIKKYVKKMEQLAVEELPF
jgi:hypothetical protein